ncbi:MAG: hypothetical protein PUE12_18525 [Oscillospiraceae bacterium]|nr:hypothetical protein [Oscillospiraceae bacterium]
MGNDILTENMKFWLKELYNDAAEDFYGGASNLHLMALGSEGESAGQLEYYAEEQRAFANILKSKANEINFN